MQVKETIRDESRENKEYLKESTREMLLSSPLITNIIPNTYTHIPTVTLVCYHYEFLLRNEKVVLPPSYLQLGPP